MTSVKRFWRPAVVTAPKVTSGKAGVTAEAHKQHSLKGWNRCARSCKNSSPTRNSIKIEEVLVKSKFEPREVRKWSNSCMYWSRHSDSLALGTQKRRAKVLYSMSKCFRATSIGLLNMINGSKAANPFTILLVSPVRFKTSLMRNWMYCWLSLTKAVFTVSVVACMAGRSDFSRKGCPQPEPCLLFPLG